MNVCLYCKRTFFAQISWRSFIGINEEHVLCEQCRSNLIPIVEPICEHCGRPFHERTRLYKQDNICLDCIRWERQPTWKGVLRKNRSLYKYEPFLQALIAQFKYRGDAELAKVFHDPLLKLYEKEFRHHILVPIPLSEAREYERGFNQAQLLAEGIGEPIHALFCLNETNKQSKKNRQQRMAAKSSFVFNDRVDKIIKNTDILLIDDIYTTGATVRNAAKVLLMNGARTVSSLTTSR